MAYKLRDRNQKRIYFSTSSSDSDSSYCGSEYSRTRPRRQQKQATNIEIGSSSSVRRSGRPIKRRVYGGDQNQSFEVGESSRGRNQAPYSLQNQNTSNVENPEEKKNVLVMVDRLADY